MTALQQVEQLLPAMSPTTKARLYQKIAGVSSDLFPGIEKTRGVCGGSACVIRTRIPVWSLVAWKKLGASDEQLLKSYPTLIQQDLDNAWGYHLIHTQEIETEIKENDEA
ncbi:MAG: DUF433 domain-containing protein [Saprospiraceae bacterium]